MNIETQTRFSARFNIDTFGNAVSFLMRKSYSYNEIYPIINYNKAYRPFQFTFRIF